MEPSKALELLSGILHGPQFTANWESFVAINQSINAVADALKELAELKAPKP